MCFLPLKLIPFNISINLRNHRKLLVIDDEVGYIQLTKFQTVLRGPSSNVAVLAIILFIITLLATWLYPNSFNFYTPTNFPYDRHCQYQFAQSRASES